MNGAAPVPGGAARRSPLEWALVAVAFVASLVLLWTVTHSLAAISGFTGGIIALSALIWTLAKSRVSEVRSEWALPDWSVTVAAISRPDVGVCITDRAGRLTCANPVYESWFGTGQAPPRLDTDAPSLERLGKASRIAWRDGHGSVDLVENAAGRWRAEAERVGRGDDFLVWRFIPLVVADPVSDLVRAVEGKVGRALARYGIAAAVVDAGGQIRAASAGFAEHASGGAASLLAGQPFTAYLKQDERDRLTWSREGRRGNPLTMYYVPVADPDGGDPDMDKVPSLMLLMEAGIAIGGGAASEAPSAAPHLEALLGQLPLGLAMADRDGRMLFANMAFMRGAGMDGEAPPPYPTDLVVREDKGALSDAVRRFSQGPASSGDIAVRLKHQPDEPVSLSLAGVRGLGEAAVLLSLTDSTEQSRLKRQVAQATKMQAVGQLAGGVAHDFNNVLTAILGTCDLMLLRHTPGDSDYDDIQQIRANSNRAASLTRQLLAFSRQQTLRPEVLQLPDVVSDIGQMLKRLVGEKIQFSVTHDRDLGPVRADPTQLEQVIVNLVVNARDALSGKTGAAGKLDGHAKLTLSTRRMSADQVRAMRSDILPQADYTVLMVEDTGSGIAPEHLGKIFEPFFTTKEQGRGGTLGGTGLGLSTVYGVVKQSGGFIFATSEVGKGTKFTVYFPVHHGEVAIAAPKTEALRAWSGGGKVLLVEDEDTVRAVAERALTRAGYTVTTASDGEEGLELVLETAKAGEAFDIVVSDVVMPVMDGPAMISAIRKLYPDLPVLFMSGYAEEQLRKEIDLANVHFLPKPFSVQQISDKVGGVLAGG